MENNSKKPGSGLGNALVRAGNQMVAPRGLTGLGRPASAADTALVQSVRGNQAERDSALVHAQAARAVTPEQLEAIRRQVEDELRGKVSASAAIAIDFTASTGPQIQALITHAERLAENLRQKHRAGVRILPVIFRGEHLDGLPAIFGSVNDLAWFRQQGNVGNGRGAPPIVAGLQAVLASGFFDDAEKGPLEARTCVVLSDNEFEKDSGYDEVMRAFQSLRVSVASFVSPEDSYYLDSYRKSHVKALEPLAERGLVVAGQVDPVEMIAQFVGYATGEQIRQLAASDARLTRAHALASRQGGAPLRTAPLHIPFRQVLADGGLTAQAALVSQGRPALTDGK